MILESKGSVVLNPQTLCAGMFLALVAAGFEVLRDKMPEYAPTLPHQFGMHAMGVIVSFAVVFRTNLGWQRYWEAMTQLHFCYSKWADAYCQFLAFATATLNQTREKGPAPEKVARILTLTRSLDAHFGLLSAVAADRLNKGDTNRMERRAGIAKWKDQIIRRHELRQGPDLTGASRMPTFTDRVTGGAQDCHYSFEGHYVLNSMPTPEELASLEHCSDRVSKVMFWIVHDLAAVSRDLDTAPPIQSRMFQELSNGMLGFNNCLKISDVPFPFPYAQLLTVVLSLYSLFIPLYISCFTEHVFISPLVSFVLFVGIWGVNEVAKELENPFGADTNDISLVDFHARFIDILNEFDLPYIPEQIYPKLKGDNLALDIVKDAKRMAKADATKIMDPPSPANQPVAQKPNVTETHPGVAAFSIPVWDCRPDEGKTGCFSGGFCAEEPLANDMSEIKLEAPRAPQAPPPPPPPAGGSRAPAPLTASRGPASTVQAIEQGLVEINGRMEAHLARMAQDLDLISKFAAAHDQSNRFLGQVSRGQC